MEETHMGNRNSGERKCTATCLLLNGQSYESKWSTSQLWARLGQTNYVSLFLACGSSART